MKDLRSRKLLSLRLTKEESIVILGKQKNFIDSVKNILNEVPYLSLPLHTRIM